MFGAIDEMNFIINVIKVKYNNLVSDSRFSEILSGSVWALSARVFSTGLGFIFTMVVARLYGADIMGILAVINSFLVIVTLFTVFGMHTSIIRLIPEHLIQYSVTSAFKLYRKVLFFVVGVSLLASLVFFITADSVANKIFSKPHLTTYFAIASFFIVFKSLSILSTHSIRGLKLTRLFALMLALPQSYNLILLICISIIHPSISAPVWAYLGGFALTGITGWSILEFVFKKKIRPVDIIHPTPYRMILTISMPMFISTAMTYLIGETGVIILGIFRSEAEVGVYAVAVKLAVMTSFVLEAISSIGAPKFSELFQLGRFGELFHVAKKSAKLIYYTTTPILAVLVVFGKPILGIAFGNEFIIAYKALVILVIGQFVNCMAGASATFMNMTGNQEIFRNILVLAGGINVLLNLLLSPRIGITGAAISSMVSLSFWNIATLIYIKLKYGMTTGYFPNSHLWKVKER